MSPRQRVNAALDFSGPDRLPRDIWGFRHMRAHRPNDWSLVTGRFPLDMLRSPSVLGPSRRAIDRRAKLVDKGTRVDDWGSVWASVQKGASGEVKLPVLADWANFSEYQPPWEMLENPQTEVVNQMCRETEGFVLAEVGPGPFERIQFLRGTENVFYDLAEQSRDLHRLLDMVHQFYLEYYKLHCQTSVDGIAMGDDWGSQTSLLISPEMWRDLFKPLYKQYFEICRSAGKRVFMHSDGMIREIIPEFIEIGIEAINCQVQVMDIFKLGREFRGKVCFWGTLDQQFVLPFGKEDDVRRAVRDVRDNLEDVNGGLIAQLFWGIETPIENVMAAFDEWSK